MKKYLFFSMAITAMMFTACSSDDDAIDISNNYQGVTFYAQLPKKATNRVSYLDTSEGTAYSTKAEWEEGDNLYCSYYYLSGDTKTKFGKGRPVTKATGATYLATSPISDTYIYCNYPASSYKVAVVDDETSSSCTWTVPDGSTAYIFSDSEFSSQMKNYNIMIGSLMFASGDTPGSDKHVILFNVFSLLKFTIKVPTTATALSQITIAASSNGTARDNVNLRGNFSLVGGKATVTWDGGIVGRYEIKGTSIALNDIGDANYKEATFYALVRPQTFNGLWLEVKDNADTPVTYRYVKTGAQELQAGYMYGIKAKVAVP